MQQLLNRKLLIAAVAAILLLVIVLLVACSPDKAKKVVKKSGNDKITLTYWRQFDDKAVFDPIIAEYQKENPNVTIEYKKIDGDYETKLLEALAAGRGPDMFSVNNFWMPRYFDKTVPIPEDLLSTDDFSRQFFPVATTDNVKDKRVYGIPYSIDTLALYSNNELLNKAEVDEPPATWVDLVGDREPVTGKLRDPAKPGQLEKLRLKTGDVIEQGAIAMGDATTVVRAPDILSLLMLQNGTEMVNSDRNQASFNLRQKDGNAESNLGTRGLDFYTSFARPRDYNYAWDARLGDSTKAFTDGRVAYMVGYAYLLPRIELMNPQLQFSVSPVPQIGGVEPVNFANYWTETVSKSSANQEEAWKFIKYVSSNEQLGAYTSATRRPPSRRDVSPEGNIRSFYDQNATAKTWFKGDQNKTDAVFVNMIKQVVSGEVSQNAIDRAANQVTDILKSLPSGPK